jgi:hypothetical protein
LEALATLAAKRVDGFLKRLLLCIEGTDTK